MTDQPVQNPLEAPDGWLMSVAMKQAGYYLAKAIAGLTAAPATVHLLNHIGVTIDPASNTATIAFPALIGAILHWIHDYLKVKFPKIPFL